MKKIIIYVTLVAGLVCSSCSGWLDLTPNNERVTSEYWKTKEDVEAVLASGYNCLRKMVPTLVDWGELRGGSVYSPSNSAKQKLQNFQLTPNDALCKWAGMYDVLNMANSVIKYAPEAQAVDETYNLQSMNSHLSEAYFIRALTYFYLVRNFRDVPLVLEPYVDDSAPYRIAQSTEAQVIAQIKEDLKVAIESGGAKEFFDDDDWSGASKGRATKWALYALMADVCLWSGDYDGCIQYADMVLDATAIQRPAFMKDGTLWFSIYYPGNSNESIFELNWDQNAYDIQQEGSPSELFKVASKTTYEFVWDESGDKMANRLLAEEEEGSLRAANTYNLSGTSDYCIWKYQGTILNNKTSTRPSTGQDANWIVYRMADVMLMKAEALIWKGQSGYQDALDLMNTVRERSLLSDLSLDASSAGEQDMLEALLHERDMELAAEGKRWYDLLRFARGKGGIYKDAFISLIEANNITANLSWLHSALINEDAWFLPINQSEMDVNPLLIQNPHYTGVTA